MKKLVIRRIKTAARIIGQWLKYEVRPHSSVDRATASGAVECSSSLHGGARHPPSRWMFLYPDGTLVLVQDALVTFMAFLDTIIR